MSKTKSKLILLAAIYTFLPVSSFSQWRISDFDTSAYAQYKYNDQLLVAAAVGSVPNIEILLKRKADINAETIDGLTPLIFAVANKHTEAVRVLLKYKPVVDKTTPTWETPLLISVKNNSFEIAELLIRAGADVNHADRYGATSLHYSATYGYPDITDLLLYYEADPELTTTDGSTPLHAAIWAGQIAAADLLLQNGAPVDEKDNAGLTPFLLAAYFGDTVAMELLLEYKADIAAKNNKGFTALTLAILSDQKEAVEYLIDKRQKWETEQPAANPYSIAAKYRKKDIITLLEQKKFPGNANVRIDQVTITLSSRFTAKDMYSGLSFEFREPLMNAGFSAGFDTKLWPTRVLVKRSENLMYQFWDQSSVAYAGIFKDFTLSEPHPGLSTVFTASLRGGYSFGNRFKGSYEGPEARFRILPAATFRVDISGLSLSAGLEYAKTGYYRPGPLWLRVGVSWTSFFDDVRLKIKPPKWY